MPAINCNGTISTVGYFLTIKIKIANDIGIMKAAILPDIWPGDKEVPIIKIIPEIAKIIEIKVNFEIFSFKNKYPNSAKNIVWVWIIKFVFATVVLYMAKTYPQKPVDNIKPPISPGIPELTKAVKNFFLYVSIKKILTTNIKKIDLQNKICHKFAPWNDFTISPPKLRLKAPRNTNSGPGNLDIIFIRFDLKDFLFPFEIIWKVFQPLLIQLI